ncbi:MAG: C40 family peptidase [Bacilli bacterium]|nr:C40 family peptidase [Bacilli bacterium]
MNEAPKVPGNNPLPQGTNPAAGGGNPKTQAITQGVQQGTNVLDKVTDKIAGDDGKQTPQLGEQVVDKEPQVDENGNPTEPELKPGDKVAPGYEVGEDGKVKQSATSRFQSAFAGGAAAYFSGGNAEAAKAAKDVSNSKTGRRVSDALEKNAAVKKTAEAAEQAGVLDTAEGVIDGVVAAKNMDVKALAENAKKIKQGKGKLKKFLIKRLVLTAIALLFPIIMGVLLLSIVATAFADESDTSSSQVYENTYEYEWDEKADTDDPGESGGDDSGGGSGGGGGGHNEYQGHRLSEEEIQKIISEIPGWDSLSQQRKSIIRAALSAVGLNYLYGGKATGPGLGGIPSTGIDCSNFVNWAYWTGLGTNPGFGTTANIFNNSGGWFNQVSFDGMKPGDVGVRRANGEGHTAIFLGNNRWVHASSAKTGIKVSVYNTQNVFMRFYSYKGI